MSCVCAGTAVVHSTSVRLRPDGRFTFMTIMRPLSDPLGAAAVVWDYDGTLVDTRGADEAAVALLLEADPGAATGTEIFWALEGRPIIERIDLAWPGRADELLPLFDRPIPPRIFPGIVAA